MVDARMRGRRDRGLGVIGDAEPRASIIARSLAPSPTAIVSSSADAEPAR